jgi:hypothetical protein
MSCDTVDCEQRNHQMSIDVAPNQTTWTRLGTWINPTWWTLLVVLPWAIGLAWTIHDWNKDRAVAQRERVAVGIITVHEVSNHNQYRYRFSIDGQSYSGLGSSPNDFSNSGSSSKEEIAVGQQVPVYYDPLDPSTNALRDFANLSTDSLRPVPILVLGIGAVAIYIFIRRRQINLKMGRSELA